MGEITRVGVDLAKRVIQVHAVDATGRVIVAKQLTARRVHRVVCAVAARLSRRHGGLLGVAPLGTTAASDGHGGEADRAALRLTLSSERQDRQERRSRCGGDLRGGFASQHALRARQERRAAKHDGAAPAARGLQGRANRLHQPNPWLAGRVRLGLRATPRSAACSRCPRSSKTRATSWARSRVMALQRAHLHWIELECHIAWCDERIAMHVRSDEQAKAAAKLCGIGPVTASALVATRRTTSSSSRTAAQFGAWMGLVPRQNSSGGKAVWASITKRGDELPANAADPGCQVGGDDRAQAQRSHLAMDRPAAWPRRLAEGRGGVGQQERAHPVGRYWSRVRASIPNTYPIKPEGPAIGRQPWQVEVRLD